MANPARVDLAAIRTRLAGESGPRLWRSLEELAETPEVRRYLEAEFPDIAQAGSMDRRTWLQLMAASLALAGLAGCSPGENSNDRSLLSPARPSPGQASGAPLVYATSLELNGRGRGALVKTQQGRPIKIEGNPLHPASLGATDVFMQAEVLSLYAPDRARTPREGGRERDWESLQRYLGALRGELIASGGAGLHVLMPPVASPTLARLTAAAQRMFPQARWHLFAPIVDDYRRSGAELAFGRPLDMVYDLTAVDTLVALGGDLFSTAPGHLRCAADYQARRRDPNRALPQLFAVESTPSLVGTRADERVILRPRDMDAFARALEGSLEGRDTPTAETHPAAIRIAAALRRAGPRGLVAAGREQSPQVHALAHAMNARLGAFGSTLHAVEPVRPAIDEMASISELAEAIAAGRATRLLILGGNPAYDAPADLDLAALIRRVPLSVHLGYYRDETAAACRWHVPRCHALEAFGDLRAFDGTVGLCQPATSRLVPSLSPEEMLASLIGEAPESRVIVEATWRELWGEPFDARFARALEDGVVADTAFPPVPVSLRDDRDRPAAPRKDGAYDLVFAPDPSVWDGRFARNGWLQELPKPLTKQVWGNAALIAPATAEALRLDSGDVIAISAGERVIEAPVWLMPGQAPDTITLPLGYGQAAFGGPIGFDAYRLRSTDAPWFAAGEIRRVGRREPVVTTQQHHSMEGRDIVRTVAPGNPAPARPGPQPSLYPEWPYRNHAWGMSIDLDACIGCNACVVACQAENNIPVVGVEEVARGREMHWLRVDRYYAGAPDEPQAYFQPVLCMHCEKAPCEIVCPVNATVHSSEGLNDMVYNRCIGTRTCSNNCPYKVRRFNFLDYQTTAYAAADEVMNPAVTVRDRGVMEKCTYCIQRIAAARIDARIDDRPVRDGEIVTACQQACPTQAIVFGDVNDPSSAVSRLKAMPRDYALLGELNTQPRTTYLARIEAARLPGDGGSG